MGTAAHHLCVFLLPVLLLVTSACQLVAPSSHTVASSLLSSSLRSSQSFSHFSSRSFTQIPDTENPVVIPADKSTVEEFCSRIHRNLLKNFKYALVWGTSVKHNPQIVGKEHQLADEDIVQIVKKI